MKKITATAASILFTVFAIAATAEQKPAKKQVAAVSTVVVSEAEHDYKLEREACCGPNQ